MNNLPPANQATYQTRNNVWYCPNCKSFKTYTHGGVSNPPECCKNQMSLRSRKDFEDSAETEEQAQ